VRGRDRRQVLVKAGERAGAVTAVRETVEAVVATGGVRGISLAVDADPQ
jgi:hypothetical protein